MDTPFSSREPFPFEGCWFVLSLIILYFPVGFFKFYRGRHEFSPQHELTVEVSSRFYSAACILIILSLFINWGNIIDSNMLDVFMVYMIFVLLEVAMFAETYMLQDRFGMYLLGASLIFSLPLFIMSALKQWTITHILFSENIYMFNNEPLFSRWILLSPLALFFFSLLSNTIAMGNALEKLASIQRSLQNGSMSNHPTQ